mmetsp:Transcript_781/g.1587  ORF Transcript_781/g.1587 Transcript_781/m.1587 type:complete len:235 (-) Transcript_781:49-753(-)
MQRGLTSGLYHGSCFLAGITKRGFATFACPRTLLGVGPRCTADDVKKAYRQRAKEWHPDLCATGDKKAAVERFQELQAAYQALLEEIRTGRKAGSASSRAHSQRAPHEQPSWAGTRADPREWAEEAAAYKAPEQPLVMKLPSGLRHLKLGAAGLFVGWLAWTFLDSRLAREQEIRDDLEFGAKRIRLRQEHAERMQQEMLARRSSRQQQTEERITLAERSAAQAAQRRRETAEQ